MRSPTGARRKLVIFTEHRDTLNYLQERITGVLGRSEAVVVIHGAIGREERRSAQDRFTYDPDALVLVATDAAGEGINLQCAHLMVNYDLPWNPNRLEQRFGRIHRIGQQEVCHLWNLVANETREGDVYKRLLDKLEEERLALGGQVFDILGRLVFDNESLRDLLLQAVRYGDDPQVQQRLFQKVEHALNTDKIRELIYGGALVREAMDGATVQRVREEMERADVRRLQPHYVESFFLRAFRELGGSVHQREPRRYEITHVPQAICRRDRETGRGAIVQKRYERVTFEREQVSRQGLPTAAYLCPGHPLLDATISLTMEQRGEVLRRGAMLVDPLEPGTSTRALIALEHTITDGRTRTDGNPCVVSQRFLFVELDEQGNALDAGSAPYLDYRPLTEEEQTLLESVQPAAWMHGDLERRAIGFAAQTLVPQHYQEVRRQREDWVDRARKAVHERLTRAINYWDNRAEDLRLREDAADQPHTTSERARRRRDELIERLKTRMEELERERQLHRPVPRVVAGALIVPIGLLNRLRAGDTPWLTQAIDTRRSEQLAMQAVMERERALGYEPVDVSAQKRGYDIESRRPDGSMRFIEVKGRAPGADSLTVTRNEVLTALNRPQDWWLALVEIDGGTVGTPRYIRAPFSREPEFFMTTQQCKIAELLRHAEPPA